MVLGDVGNVRLSPRISAVSPVLGVRVKRFQPAM
jgi:hypothetical protein